jgi:hypothetical protein
MTAHVVEPVIAEPPSMPIPCSAQTAPTTTRRIPGMTNSHIRFTRDTLVENRAVRGPYQPRSPGVP